MSSVTDEALIIVVYNLGVTGSDWCKSKKDQVWRPAVIERCVPNDMVGMCVDLGLSVSVERPLALLRWCYHPSGTGWPQINVWT